MAQDTVRSREMAELAEQRSAVYAFLSSIFIVLPDQGFVGRLKDGRIGTLLEALSADDVSPDIQTGVRLIQGYLASLQTMPVDQVETDLAVERARLLRGIKPGYGPPPPYESVYRGTADSGAGQTLLQVKRAFADAGVSVPESVHEPADYIGLELELMRHLANQEAQAWRAGDEAKARVWLDKQKAFLIDHLAGWVPEFADLMAEHAALGFYQGVARIMKGFVISDRAHLADEVP